MKPISSLLLSLFLGIAIAPQVKAQISTDGTTNTTVNTTDNAIDIDRGNRTGANLFHSFEEFSVPNGSEAFFNNANDIVNIFSRVTGGDISNIDGLIRANGNANLFLINPAGIIFGESASLDLGGSFIASTAESIVFTEDLEFLATDAENSPLLTVNMPIGLQFGANPGSIQVQGDRGDTNANVADTQDGLQVLPDQTLGLLGGDIDLKGAALEAIGGRVELGSVAENSLVSLTSTNPGWSLGYQNVSSFQNLRLLDNSNITVSGNGKGSIAINANNIDLNSGSNLEAGINADFQLADASARDITLNASGTISIDNGTIINEVQEQAIGNGGDVKLTGRSLFLNNGSSIAANSFGQGNTGDIIINASDTFSFDGADKSSEETFISASLFGAGKGGQIAINAPKISLNNGASIAANSVGRGNAGNIEISSSDNVVISGTNSGIGSQVYDDAVGNGGTITVDVPKLSVLNGATIVAHTDAQGNAGDITVNAQEVFLDGVGSNGGSGIGSAAFELASGNGGAIVIDTDSLNVTNGATLLVSNFGEKDAGSVTINATGAVSFDGIGTNGYSSSAFSTVEAGSNGNGGEIKITANSLTVNSGAVIGASTSGQGRGGDINLDVDTLQVQSGGQILTTSRGSGDAGNIFINTTENTIITGSDPTFPERLARIGRPVIRNEGAASGIFANTDATSTGSGGNINISTQNLSISDDARINVTNQGNAAIGATGGNVALQIADNLTLRDNGTISAQAVENANGGNVSIDADFVIAFPNQNNDIIAAAAQGTGGNINIFANALFGIEGRSSIPSNNTNDIDASSEFGLDGTVEINELDVNPVEGLEELPIEVIDVTRLVEQNLCQQGEGSEFVVTGKGGIAPNPSQARSGEIDEVDLIEPATVGEAKGRDEQSFALTETDAEEKMVEAQGWIVNDRGIVELVARKTDLSDSAPQFNNIKVCP